MRTPQGVKENVNRRAVSMVVVIMKTEMVSQRYLQQVSLD